MVPSFAPRPGFALLAPLAFLALLPTAAPAAETVERDLVVYGGTSAGIVAGIQALAMGKSVVVIEPSEREGGLTTGGLGQTDIGNKQVIGGLAREFYRRIATHYADDAAWTWQRREDYRDSGQTRTAQGEATMWTFEPSAALQVYRDWIAETGLELVHEERLDRKAGVKMEEGRILSIAMESGRVFAGKMFLDATYEGDLMAAAEVGYTVGREANAQYGETLNGVQTAMAKHHQFVKGVDPYFVPGDPASGLIPFIDPEGPGEEGSGDRRVQAYCFRMCLTDHPENRIPFAKPEGYEERFYELLLRNYEAGETGLPWINSSMPNRKTDTNNRLGFSTDFIGQNYDYPEAGYAEREAIVARHRLYQRGLMWTLAYHPRMPEKIRAEVSRWGMTKDEFPEGGGWQGQLYIREARRMVSDFVMTQNHCQHREPVPRPVGMGAYTMDSHHVQRHLDADGHVRNEGDVQVGGFPPYPIDYLSLVPKQGECGNLLVPVCLSATHIAFGSIRMEPVFMVLGQSAATAASLAIDAGVAVQEIDYTALRDRLEGDGQVLAYTAPPRPAANYTALDSLEGLVVDDSAAKLTGEWVASVLSTGIHQGYRHDNDARDGRASAVFSAELTVPGRYEVQVAWSPNANRATRVPVRVEHADGTSEASVNQRERPPIDGLFGSVGVFRFEKGGTVTITNAGTDGHVIIDAVRWVKAE
jgi:hypothetical protein